MITLNLRPEYSSKISGMVLMAPAVYGYDYKTKTNKVTIPIYSKVVILSKQNEIHGKECMKTEIHEFFIFRLDPDSFVAG